MKRIRKTFWYAWLLAFSILPSRLKVIILNAQGHVVHPTARLGICFFDVKVLELGRNVSIASFNVFKNLSKLTMEEGARVGGKFNHFTASENNNLENEMFGCVHIGRSSSITSKHLFDAQDLIKIGDRTLIAGLKSTFFTHTVTADDVAINKPIKIGDTCYIGSHCMFLPGACLDSSTFVGAAAVVTKDFSGNQCVLVAGNPAKVVKSYPKDSAYWRRPYDSFRPKRNPAV
ncbi:acyltransferase [Bradyrhizobium lupini]